MKKSRSVLSVTGEEVRTQTTRDVPRENQLSLSLVSMSVDARQSRLSDLIVCVCVFS